MQAARKAVGATLALVKLAAGVQAGEHQLDHWRFFFRVHTKGNTSAVVVHGHRAVGVQYDLDFLAMAGQRLVGGVVQDLLDDVQRVVGAGVHAGSLLDRLQAFENPDGTFGIGLGGGRWGECFG